MRGNPNAQERLTAALVQMAAQGQRPRCGGPGVHNHWVSEDQDERQLATTSCTGCPILTECYDAGQDESWGVWGGRDRSVTAATRKRDAA